MNIRFPFLSVAVLLLCCSAKAQLSTKFVSVTDLGSHTYQLSGGTLSSGTYAWQMAYSTTGPWTVVTTGSNTITVTATATNYYRLANFTSSLTHYSCVVRIAPLPCDTPTVSASKTTPCPTDTVTLYSGISGSCYLYQWQDSLSGDISGATQSAYVVTPPITATKKYRLKFTCSSGTTYSNWFTLHPVTECDTAEVTLSKTIACAGDSLSLTATAVSPCSALQWEDSLSGSIAGATSATLRLSAPSSKTAYRLKTTCALGKTAYSRWVAFTPYSCDTPLLSISATKGCAGDTITMLASGIAPCVALQWEDSLSGLIPGANDSLLMVTAGTARNAYRLQATCASGSIIYSGWMSFTPFTSCADSVWPGDINHDFTADYTDILHLGLAYGFTGPGRPGASADWRAQYAPNWPYFFPSTVNYKHADCNGDGAVDTGDIAPILLNYGKIHMAGETVPPYPPKVPGWPDLYFDLKSLHPAPGDIVTVPLLLGSSLTPMKHLYGIAAKLYVNTEPLSTAADMDSRLNWLSAPVHTVAFTHTSGNNILDWTLVRNDHTNNSGYGTLGLLTFQVPSTLADGSLLALNFLSVKLVDSAGHELSEYNVIQDTVVVRSAGLSEQYTQRRYYIYPNPASEKLTITQSVGQRMTATAVISDASGRKCMQQKLQFTDGKAELPLHTAPGIYLLRLENEGELLHQERIIIR